MSRDNKVQFGFSSLATRRSSLVWVSGHRVVGALSLMPAKKRVRAQPKNPAAWSSRL
jgi:hypothetical protein